MESFCEGVEKLKNIKIDTEFITLGQFLKVANIISSGGMAKWFLSEYRILVNGEIEQRRGRKLRSGDKIEVQDNGTFLIRND